MVACTLPRMDIRKALMQSIARRGDDESIDVLIALLLLTMDDRIEAALTHIVQLEHAIMADETKLDADVQQVSADFDEIATGIKSIQSQLAAGNTAAAQAEVDSLVTKLDPLAAKVRATASQFDAPTPSPAPTPPSA